MGRLLGYVPFGSGLSVAPSTGEAIGETRTGRSVSGEVVVSVGVGIGGLFWEAADVDMDISRCHRRQERFSSRRPSWIEFLHLVNTNRHGRAVRKMRKEGYDLKNALTSPKTANGDFTLEIFDSVGSKREKDGGR